MAKQKGGKTPTPNDQRSVDKNPNNPAHKDANDNRANQINPEHTRTNPPAKTVGNDGNGDKKA